MDLERLGQALEAGVAVERDDVVRFGTERKEVGAVPRPVETPVEIGVVLAAPLEKKVANVRDIRPRHEGEAAGVAAHAAALEEARLGVETLADLRRVEAPAPGGTAVDGAQAAGPSGAVRRVVALRPERPQLEARRGIE